MLQIITRFATSLFLSLLMLQQTHFTLNTPLMT
jgi:hypothetical protein